MPGIFITRGMSVSIPNFSRKIGEDGKLEIPPLVMHVRFDVSPTWIQLAWQHLEAARVARLEREKAWAGTDEKAKALTLEAEFEPAMQAIVAVAIAWDAIYAVLLHFAQIQPDLLEKWRTGRTARYSQVTEVIRRAFLLKPKGAAALRNNLKEIFRYRDLAVHPSGRFQAALLHPELDVGVEWRFVYFRASNAETAVTTASAMLWDLAHNGKAKDQKVAEYQKTLASRLQEIFPNGVPNVSASSAEKD